MLYKVLYYVLYCVPQWCGVYYERVRLGRSIGTGIYVLGFRITMGDFKERM